MFWSFLAATSRILTFNCMARALQLKQVIYKLWALRSNLRCIFVFSYSTILNVHFNRCSFLRQYFHTAIFFQDFDFERWGLQGQLRPLVLLIWHHSNTLNPFGSISGRCQNSLCILTGVYPYFFRLKKRQQFDTFLVNFLVRKSY